MTAIDVIVFFAELKGMRERRRARAGPSGSSGWGWPTGAREGRDAVEGHAAEGAVHHHGVHEPELLILDEPRPGWIRSTRRCCATPSWARKQGPDGHLQHAQHGAGGADLRVRLHHRGGTKGARRVARRHQARPRGPQYRVEFESVTPAVLALMNDGRPRRRRARGRCLGAGAALAGGRRPGAGGTASADAAVAGSSASGPRCIRSSSTGSAMPRSRRGVRRWACMTSGWSSGASFASASHRGRSYRHAHVPADHGGADPAAAPRSDRGGTERTLVMVNDGPAGVGNAFAVALGAPAIGERNTYTSCPSPGPLRPGARRPDGQGREQGNRRLRRAARGRAPDAARSSSARATSAASR